VKGLAFCDRVPGDVAPNRSRCLPSYRLIPFTSTRLTFVLQRQGTPPDRIVLSSDGKPSIVASPRAQGLPVDQLPCNGIARSVVAKNRRGIRAPRRLGWIGSASSHCFSPPRQARLSSFFWRSCGCVEAEGKRTYTRAARSAPLLSLRPCPCCMRTKAY